MTLAIVGSPGFGSLKLVRDYIADLSKDTKVIAMGWSRVAEVASWEASRERGLPFEADYSGVIRTTIDGLVVFWDGQDMELQDVFLTAIEQGRYVEVHYESGKVSVYPAHTGGAAA